MEEKALTVIPGQHELTPASPQEQVNKAHEMAKILQGVVTQAGLSINLGGKKPHLQFEAWQTIGRFFNCTPITEWTKPMWHEEKIVAWEAKVNVIDSTGRVIASAESMCGKDEPNWKTKPAFAMRSMAQTRAAGKALRSVFAFVAVLAGYSPTPAEEMDADFVKDDKPKKESEPDKPPKHKPLNKTQGEKIIDIASKLDPPLSVDETKLVIDWYSENNEHGGRTFEAGQALIFGFAAILDRYIDAREKEAKNDAGAN